MKEDGQVALSEQGDELVLGGEATTLPADWRPPRRRVPFVPAGLMGAGAGIGMGVGAVAVAGFAVGALAVGALAIGALSVGRARVRRLEIGELSVDRLRVRRLLVESPTGAPGRR